MSSLTYVVNTSTLSWGWGWADDWTGGHDWNINYPFGISGDWAPISDAMRRDVGHPLPCCGSFLLVNKNAPLFAKPCTGYQQVFVFQGGKFGGRQLFVPTHTDPQYIGIGVVCTRLPIDKEQVGGPPPPVGAYYCINKAFLQDIGRQVMPECADGNCDKNKLRLNRAVEGCVNITLYNTFRILSYDDVLAGCKGLRGTSALKDISSDDCSYVLNALYTADDIKTGKADFCATNPGWCDKTMKKFCVDYPNHSACDCINTESRPLWKEVDALLVPAAKLAPLACKSPFCNARNDVFKTSQMITDVRNCPDIRYVDQSVRVDGQGNITRVTQTGNIGGDTTNTTTGITTEQTNTIIGMNPTLFYILLFLFVVLIIVLSIKYNDDPPRYPPPQMQI